MSMNLQMPRKFTKIMHLANFPRFQEDAEMDAPKIKKTLPENTTIEQVACVPRLIQKKQEKEEEE